MLNAKSGNVYSVHLPNHVDTDKLDMVVSAAIKEVPAEEIINHYLNSDELTNDERKQLDIYGEIKSPAIKLHVIV